MRQRIPSAIAGALAAAVALAVSELAAGAILAIPSLVESVGGVFINNVPSGLKEFAIETFGTNDKLVLVIGIAVVVLLLGAVVGVFARRWMWLGVVVFAGFGLMGAAAAINLDFEVVPSFLGGGISVLAGLMTLTWLYGRIERDANADEPAGVADPGRRAFIAGAGAVFGLAVVAAGAGRALIARATRMIAGRDEVVLPMPAEVAAAPPAGASFSVPEITRLVSRNNNFYKIDTTLSPPQVDLASWTLRIHGMVDREVEFTFDELLAMDMVERYITLTCVSNEVGGHLIGNAKWLGIPLPTFLDLAGVQDGATQIVGRAVDGFTVGFPTEAAFDGRDALLAVGMNDEPLPFDHGFPARLVVSGLYGYVSATKWLSDIELTTWDAFDAYWVPRGWSKLGPIKTQSRIDTPRSGAVVGTGEQTIAGVAWAPNIGIERVEVQVDGNDWTEAELAASLDQDTWRQWKLAWDMQPGRHNIRARATDASGYTQTRDRVPPAPNGASGWHTISVQAEA